MRRGEMSYFGAAMICFATFADDADAHFGPAATLPGHVCWSMSFSIAIGFDSRQSPRLMDSYAGNTVFIELHLKCHISQSQHCHYSKPKKAFTYLHELIVTY